MDDNAWVSVDFMVASFILILTIPGIIAIVEDRVSTANSIQEMSEAKVLAENMAETIEMVYSGGEGCSIIYKMPKNISDKKFNIKINSSGVYIKFKSKIACAYIAPIQIYPDTNIDPNKTYNISNMRNKRNKTYIIIKKL